MASSQDTLIGSLAVRYSQHPGIRALIKLIPGGSSADGLLQTRADEIKSQRRREFFDELGAGQIQITEDLTRSEDFLHCFFKTMHAADNTRRKEKIKLFARMLIATVDANVFAGLDQFEEILDAFDSMSFREFEVLRLLRNSRRTVRIGALTPISQECRLIGLNL